MNEQFQPDLYKKQIANLKKKISFVLRLWPYLLISTVICVTLAILYSRYAESVYQASASIMVKDDKKGGDLNYTSALEQIGLGTNAKLVENEIEILKSLDLMQAVIDTLQLYVSVKNSGSIKKTQLFGPEIPFRLEVTNPSLAIKPVYWDIIDADSTVIIQNSAANKSVTIKYGQWFTKNGMTCRFLLNQQYIPFSNNKENKNQNSNKYEIEIISPDDALTLYSRKLSVEPVNKVATVIALGIKDTNKKRAVTLLQQLIALYIERGLRAKNKVLDNTVEFLTDRLTAVADDLRTMEGSVEKFKSQNNVTELSADAEQYLQVSKQIDLQKTDAQTQLNIVNAIENYLLQNNADPQLVPTTFGLKEPSLAQLIEKYNSVVLERERMSQRTGESNPMARELQTQVIEIRNMLLTNVRNLKQGYTIALNDISVKGVEIGSRIRNVPQLEKGLIQINRNKSVQQQLYSFLLQKREEAVVSRLANIEDSVVIVNARGLYQVAPRRQLILVLGILAGLVLPIGIAGVRSIFNNKVGDATEVQEEVQLPVIGQVSHIRKIKTPIVVDALTRSVVAEEIRNLRTAISYSGKGEKVKTIVVTSFQLGDGKSFISMNLAASYALLNKKTILLEFDLRRPNMSKSFGIESATGLTNILSGKSTFDEMLIEIEGYNSNLFLLPAGYIPPNPAELIASENMQGIIDALKQHFDYIIIDTPPYSVVSDAALLEQYADVSLVVLRQSHTSREVYANLKQRTNVKAAHPTYLVINDIGKKKRYQKNYSYNKEYFDKN